MASQLVHISLPGCNEFTEVIEAATYGAAVRTAKARYPEHRKIWCVGGDTSGDTVAPCSEYEEFDYGNGGYVDQGPVGGGESNHTSGSSASFDPAAAGCLGIFVGGAIVIGAAVLTFPVLVGGYAAKVATKAAKGHNLSTAAAVAVGAATFVGGTGAAWVAQKQVMPEVAQAQVEIVQEIHQAAHDRFIVPMFN